MAAAGPHPNTLAIAAGAPRLLSRGVNDGLRRVPGLEDLVIGSISFATVTASQGDTHTEYREARS